VQFLWVDTGQKVWQDSWNTMLSGFSAANGGVQIQRDTVEFGKARIHREGTDLTIVTWSREVLFALEAATTLAAERRRIERRLAFWKRHLRVLKVKALTVL